MPIISNEELLTRLLAAANEEKIDWHPTARPDEYTASFGGKWTLVSRHWIRGAIRYENEDPNRYIIILQNSEGEELHSIKDDEDNRVRELYLLARRRVLKVDDAIADLLKELDEPQF